MNGGTYGRLGLLFVLLLGAGVASAQARLVTTAPSQTEALFAMGLGSRVAGVSDYSEWPAEVKTLPRVGTYVRPNLETIVRLRPDVVFLEQSSNGQAERLKGLGIRTVAVPHGSLAETYAGIRVMAAGAGEAARGEALVARIQTGLAEVAAAAAKGAKVRVVVVVDRTPGLLADMVAVGPGGYLDELIAVAGGINVLAKPGVPGYPRISIETILREDPDVIVDLTDAHETDASHIAARTTDQALWGRETGLRAVREGHVALAVSSEFVVPGPRSVAAAETFFRYLHGGRSPR